MTWVLSLESIENPSPYGSYMGTVACEHILGIVSATTMREQKRS